MTVGVFLPTLVVPLRRTLVEFFKTVYVRAPLPEPPAAFQFTIQVALLDAVQGQPAGAVPVMLPVPPEAGKVLLVGDIVRLQLVVALAVLE